ncbi:hypothetical protein A7Q26_05315 [Sphingobium sp. TCM1]|nr:hypothetical protein A7Q26_05315 [Sphingobium sp. TCM1]
MNLQKCLAQTVQLVDEMEYDIDAIVIHTEITLEIMNEACAGRVHFGEEDRCGAPLDKQPLAFDPLLE